MVKDAKSWGGGDNCMKLWWVVVAMVGFPVGASAFGEVGTGGQVGYPWVTRPCQAVGAFGAKTWFVDEQCAALWPRRVVC